MSTNDSFLLSLRTNKENLSDANMDYAEIILDGAIADEVIKEIPIIKYLYGGYKVVNSVKEGFLIKKIAKFLFETSAIPEKEKIKFLNELDCDDEFKHKVIEKTLVILEKIDELNKVSILANLWKNLATGKFSFDTYQRLAHIVNQSYLEDLERLYETYKRKLEYSDEQASMFAVFGLLNTRSAPVMGGIHHHYTPTQIAVNLFEYGFNFNV